LEARSFRESITGGTVSANGETIPVAGFVHFYGLDIPVIPYDWGLATGSYSDAYVLVGSVGGRKTLYGEFNDMNQVPVRFDNAAKFFTTDGGRTLNWFEDDHTCVQPISEIQPRILAEMPWSLTRISNISCDTPAGEFFADPLSSSFIGGSSFSVATCDTV
jgi:hypothetical protein